MNERIQEIVLGNQGNYIMPFFWQHGADEATLREYMEKIQGCGIHAVCLEARPHPDYVGPQWWHDVDIVMEEARKRGMRVWILDDSHFPTGYANGAVKEAPDKLKRWYLEEYVHEVDGPLEGFRIAAATDLGSRQRMGRFFERPGETLVAVVLARRQEDEAGRVWYEQLQDVTDQLEGGWLKMDVPQGNWAIFTYQGTKQDGWNEYMLYGGLPLVLSFQAPDQKISFLKALFEETYISDIVGRHNVRNKAELEDLLNILSSAIGSLTNPEKLSATFKTVKKKKISSNTIKKYIEYLCDSFLIESAVRYDVKGKKYIDTPIKYYFTDMGLRNARLNFRQLEETHTMENIIFNELKIRGFNVDVGVITQ